MCDLIFGSGKGGSRHRLLNHRWNASRHFTQFVIAQSDPEFGNKRTVSILHIGQWKCHYVRDSIWDDTGGPPSLQWRLGSFFKKREFLSLWFESLLAKVNTGIWQTVIRLSRRTLCTFQKNMLNPYTVTNSRVPLYARYVSGTRTYVENKITVVVWWWDWLWGVGEQRRSSSRAVSRSAASKSNGHFRSRRQAVRGGNTHADKQNNVMCGALCINCTLQFSIDKNHKGSLSNFQKFL